MTLVLVFSSAASLWPQQKDIDYNDFYRFPLSIGLEYQSLTPLQSYDADYTVFDVAFDFRYPIPALTVLQPFLRAGIMKFDSADPLFPDKWDHTHWYGAVGMAYSNRFVRNFELGGELQAGFSEAVFPNAVDSGPVGSPNLLFAAAGKISLDPSYAFSIDIRPGLKYLLSLTALDKYNGFLFSLGFGVNFRFGEDPDSARAIIRSLRFAELYVEPVFGAMQSYYAKNPIGKVKITNTEKTAVSDLQVSFFQAGFMDSATLCARIPELPAGQSVEVQILATFNEQVFSTNGITPLTGELVASYSLKGRAAEQRESVSYDLHDKTAISWDDDRKVGAFITPADSALQNYVSFVRTSLKDAALRMYNAPVQLAMQLYGSLAEMGTIYQVDPVSPFMKAQDDTLVVDSVKLPRDTLKRSTGDCDDLTVLFCSLLEAAGSETGFITVPGHIYPVVNTGYESRRFRELNPDRSLTLDIDGTLWLPVEITLLGKGDFLEAWRTGCELWKRYEQDPAKRGFYRTREAQVVYRPVGLRESDLGLQYGSRDALLKVFRRDLARLVEVVTEDYLAAARKSNSKEDYNRLGMAYVQFARYDDAEQAFNKAAQLDKSYLTPRVNLANIAFLRGNFNQALKSYQSVLDVLQQRGRQGSPIAQTVLLNISKTYYELQKYPDAKSFYAQAEKLNSAGAQEFAYLGGGGARAADVGSSEERLLFAQED